MLQKARVYILIAPCGLFHVLGIILQLRDSLTSHFLLLYLDSHRVPSVKRATSHIL